MYTGLASHGLKKSRTFLVATAAPRRRRHIKINQNAPRALTAAGQVRFANEKRPSHRDVGVSFAP